jgi:hypothetical protein
MLFPRRLLRSVSSCLLLTTFTSAINLDCSDIRDDNQSWNLKPLGGPHSVKWVESHPPAEIETTVTIDICKALEVPKKVAKNEYCPNGTRGEHVLVMGSRVPDAMCCTPAVREGISADVYGRYLKSAPYNAQSTVSRIALKLSARLVSRESTEDRRANILIPKQYV